MGGSTDNTNSGFDVYDKTILVVLLIESVVILIYMENKFDCFNRQYINRGVNVQWETF